MSIADTGDLIVVAADGEVRRVVERAANMCGASVKSFSAAEAALEELKNGQPLALVTELLLPGMNGLEFCQEVRGTLELSELPILCLAGLAWGKQDLPEVLNRRFDARCLKKPFFFHRVLQEVRGMVAPPPAKTPTTRPFSSADQIATTGGVVPSQEHPRRDRRGNLIGAGKRSGKYPGTGGSPRRGAER